MKKQIASIFLFSFFVLFISINVNASELILHEGGKTSKATVIYPKKAVALDDYNTYTFSGEGAEYIAFPIEVKKAGKVIVSLSCLKNVHSANVFTSTIWFTDTSKYYCEYTYEIGLPNNYKEDICESTEDNIAVYDGKGKYYLVFQTENLGKASGTIKCNYYDSEENTLKPDKQITASMCTWHKIVVPKRGYIALTIAKEYGRDKFELYDSKKKKTSYDHMNYYFDEKYSTKYIPVEKGTYYIRDASQENEGYSIKYSFKAINSNNINKAKAKLIKKNQKVIAAIYSRDKKQQWNRYYKIKLTKKQRLVIDKYQGDFVILDSKMKSVSTSKQTLKNGIKRYRSKKALKKGVYYIRCSQNYKASEKKHTMGNIMIFSMK